MMHFIQIAFLFFYQTNKSDNKNAVISASCSMVLIVCIAQIFTWIVSLELLVKRQWAIKLLILFVFLRKHIFQLHIFLLLFGIFLALAIKRKSCSDNIVQQNMLEMRLFIFHFYPKYEYGMAYTYNNTMFLNEYFSKW